MPFCLSEGATLSEEQLSQLFSMSYIEFAKDSGVTHTKNLQGSTLESFVFSDYESMFVEHMEQVECDVYLRKMKIDSLEEFVPRTLNDIGYADYIMEYFPVSNVKIALYLKNEDDKLKIRSIMLSVSIKIRR